MKKIKCSVPIYPPFLKSQGISFALNFFNIIIFIFLLSSSLLAAPLLVDVKTNYYEIYGTSADILRNEMNAKSPNSQLGKTYDAYTSWNVIWHFNWNINNGQCYIDTATTSVDVEMNLPKWVDRNDSDAVLKNKRDRYYTALINHENGHKNFGIHAATEIEERLSKLSPSSSCTLLKQKANALGKDIVDKYIDLDHKYDIDSRHGMDTGAIFP